MFANLQVEKKVSVEFRQFHDIGGIMSWNILPLHLCRTIGEANLSSDPFATISLYPFWKYGFSFGDAKQLALNLDIQDPHKKGTAADELSVGMCCWTMEEVFGCESWADASALIKAGLVIQNSNLAPDFVCTFPDGSLGIFEAKGTTGKVSALTQSLKEGKIQACSLDAQSPIRCRVVVGTALGETNTRVVLLDPEPDSVGAIHELPVRTNLSADLVKRAAKNMRTAPTVGAPLVGARGREGTRPSPTNIATAATGTIFRSAQGEIALTTELKPDKNHTWLDIK
jgi:hypothetical protein